MSNVNQLQVNAEVIAKPKTHEIHHIRNRIWNLLAMSPVNQHVMFQTLQRFNPECVINFDEFKAYIDKKYPADLVQP
jgi:hypothetical protein